MSVVGESERNFIIKREMSAIIVGTVTMQGILKKKIKR